MLRFLPVAALAAVLPVLNAAPPASAREVTSAERRVIPFAADLPQCHDPAVLERVSEIFATKEAEYWRTNLTILEYDTIRPVAFRPWGLDHIPRRFCTATATVSDGQRRQVDYSVREELGFIGASWGIESCVRGFDRNLAYSPSCRMARP